MPAGISDSQTQLVFDIVCVKVIVYEERLSFQNYSWPFLVALSVVEMFTLCDRGWLKKVLKRLRKRKRKLSF